MVNGRKANMTDDGLSLALRFPKEASVVVIPQAEIVHAVVGLSEVGICLKSAIRIVPGTVKEVGSFVLTRPRYTPDDEWMDTLDSLCMRPSVIDYRLAPVLHTACDSKRLQPGDGTGPIVVWSTKTCAAVNELKAVVLQRTTGGMSTYDARIIPCKGPILMVDMLLHKTLDMWSDTFGMGRVVDAGADPVPIRTVQEAQEHPCVRSYILGSEDEEPDEEVPPDSDDSEWNGESDDEWNESNEGSDSDAESISDCSAASDDGDAGDSSDDSDSSDCSSISMDLTDTSE